MERDHRSAVITVAVLISLNLFTHDTAVASESPSTPDNDAALNAVFDSYWEFTMRAYPTWATYLGDHRYGSLLTDYSIAASDARDDTIATYLEAVRAFDLATLSPGQQLNARLFEESMAQSVEGRRFRSHLIPMSQQSGPHIGFPQLVNSQPLTSRAEFESYIARLDAFPTQIDQIIECMRVGMSEGIVAFRGNMEGAIPQVQAHVIDDPTESVLYGPAEQLDELPAEDADPLRTELERAISESVVPAYARLADFLEREYLPACREEPGVSALPDGQARYAYAAKVYTTTDKTPDEIHQIGLHQMERIRADMEVIRRRVEYDGTLDEFLGYLRTDPQFYFEDKQDLIDGFRDILARMDERMPLLFGKLPAAAYDLKEMEAYRAAAAPAAYYYRAPADGSRPGYFYVNTYDLPTRPKYTMEALAYHEAVPGHHLQLALQQELEDVPEFRKRGGFTAFVEGWGLYSESLPKEVGFYADPYSEFGRLTFAAWRAARLVVDTGIHSMGWSREQAIEYLKHNTALGEHDINSEIDRYIARPGQALAYKIGELKIRELRSHAEETLGESFDVRIFHDRVLEAGAIPLGVLEERMRAWVAEQSASAGG